MNLKNKQVISYVALIIFIFLLFVIVSLLTIMRGGLFSSSNKSQIPVQELPDGPGGGESQNNNQSRYVSQIIHQTPYEGTNFSFYYSFDTNEYTLYLNPNNIAAGNAEFNAFLRRNNIENRSWIENLVIVNVKPTPEP